MPHGAVADLDPLFAEFHPTATAQLLESGSPAGDPKVKP
jgi:hypothetical protein